MSIRMVYAQENFLRVYVYLNKFLSHGQICFQIFTYNNLIQGFLQQTLHPDCSELSVKHWETKMSNAILWPPDAKNRFIWKDPDAGKDWRREEKRPTEYEMVGWHHRLNGHEFEWTLGVGDGQGGLACCSPWGRKESDTTEWLNWTECHSYHVWLPLVF